MYRLVQFVLCSALSNVNRCDILLYNDVLNWHALMVVAMILKIHLVFRLWLNFVVDPVLDLFIYLSVLGAQNE